MKQFLRHFLTLATICTFCTICPEACTGDWPRTGACGGMKDKQGGREGKRKDRSPTLKAKISARPYLSQCDSVLFLKCFLIKKKRFLIHLGMINFRARNVAQLLKCLPSNHESLDSIPITALTMYDVVHLQPRDLGGRVNVLRSPRPTSSLAS